MRSLTANPPADDDRYPQIARFVADTPWAILPEKLAAILDLVEYRMTGARLTPAEIRARIGAANSRAAASSGGAVAVIPLFGTIVPRADLMSETSGGTSAERFGAAVSAAAANPDVSSILLDVDSPGGSVAMIPETAAAIAAAREQKPVVAIANTLMASAAYWLASQADEIVVTPSAMVGSIGVMAAHQDQSARMEQLGVRVSLVSAGKFKTEGNPFEPLTDEARADLQAMVDDYYAMFVGAVAGGRGVATSDVVAGFGEGRVVTADNAVRLGMADRVDTFEATVQRMLAANPASAPASARAAATYATTANSGTLATLTIAGLSGAPPGAIPASEPSDPKPAASGLFREAERVRDAADGLTTHARALLAMPRGRLSAAKRDALTEAHAAIHAAALSLRDLVASTDPADAGRAALLDAELADIQRRNATEWSA